MPTVTRSRKLKIVSKHLNPPAVEPVNARKVKAHYVGRGAFTLLQWTPGIMTCILILTVAWVFNGIRITLAHAEIGRQLCEQPLMQQTPVDCAGSALDCATHPVMMAVTEQNTAIHHHNVFRARHCLRV
jgi:hypothetical protein